MVCYANINPSSGIRAMKMFQGEMTETLFDTRTNAEAYSWFAHAGTKLKNCFQKCTGTRKWIDIDFDIPEEGGDILHGFVGAMKVHRQHVNRESPLDYHIIQTRSGYHFLVNKDTLGFNFNLVVETFNAVAVERFGKEHVEVIVNKNGMIPIPGTLQAGHEVKFIDV
jgi:hypothetical protein